MIKNKTKFLIFLNNGLVFTSFEKPKDDGITISFYDKKGLFKSYPKEEYQPRVEEVFL
jgi:hypothetical protein